MSYHPYKKSDTKMHNKMEWIARLKELEDKLARTPAQLERQPPPCTHDKNNDYGNCTCRSTYYENYEYTSLERQIKEHLQTGRFCSCGRLMELDFVHCPSCGKKPAFTTAPHRGCTNWKATLKFCPDCGKPSLGLPSSPVEERDDYAIGGEK